MSKGRTTITCAKCGKSQSTHSTNRDCCHACVPKCRAIHVFLPKIKAEEASGAK